MPIFFSGRGKRKKAKNRPGVLLMAFAATVMAGTVASVGFLRNPSEIRITPKIRMQMESIQKEQNSTDLGELLKGLDVQGIPESSATKLGKIEEFIEMRSFSDSALAAQASSLKKMNVDWSVLKRNVENQNISDKKVMVGGHSVGILVSEYGICVVGHYAVTDANQAKHFPSRDAGIEVGDIILSINQRKITSSDDLQRAVKDFYNPDVPLEFEVKRNEIVFNTKLTPIVTYGTPDEDGNTPAQIKIGLYVRDNTAGVGTLTFWDPEDGKFGALGHVVTDADTGKPITISHGSLIFAQVAGVEAGTNGHPGEKIGAFRSDADSIGIIEDNSDIGIYGVLTEKLENPIYHDPIPMASASMVKEGPAEILTVLNGSEIERFQCEILKVSRQSSAESKSLVIKITDPKLLALTGGIIQGMSGSPIVQNGMFIGAVTHVLVSDPTRGYGILAEHMIEAAQSLPASIFTSFDVELLHNLQ